jgi:hypothetical protein
MFTYNLSSGIGDKKYFLIDNNTNPINLGHTINSLLFGQKVGRTLCDFKVEA